MAPSDLQLSDAYFRLRIRDLLLRDLLLRDLLLRGLLLRGLLLRGLLPRDLVCSDANAIFPPRSGFDVRPSWYSCSA
jgi:hypothetical protein